MCPAICPTRAHHPILAYSAAFRFACGSGYVTSSRLLINCTSSLSIPVQVFSILLYNYSNNYYIFTSNTSIMGLKRKRSLQFSSDPIESTAPWTASRRDSNSLSPVDRNSPFSALEPRMEPGWGVTGDVVEITPRHLDSRTKKRFRDARPSPQQVFGEFNSSCCCSSAFTQISAFTFRAWDYSGIFL
jgi:hypothetical protein